MPITQPFLLIWPSDLTAQHRIGDNISLDYLSRVALQHRRYLIDWERVISHKRFQL
jgi:hypothetical protein